MDDQLLTQWQVEAKKLEADCGWPEPYADRKIWTRQESENKNRLNDKRKSTRIVEKGLNRGTELHLDVVQKSAKEKLKSPRAAVELEGEGEISI